MSGWGDLIEDLLDAEIDKVYQARKARRRIKEKFSASNAGYCQRATILNRLGAKETDKSEREKRVLWVGTVLHDAVHKTLEASGKLLPGSEKFMNPEGSYIWGAPDFLVKGNNAEVILDELKSIGTGSFWAKIIKNKKPHKHHVYQAVTYYLMLLSLGVKIDRVKVSYLSKQDSAIRSFWIDVTPQLLDEVQLWWAEVNDAFEKQTLPPVFEKDSEDYDKCKTCTFRTHYCEADETDPMGDSTIAKNIAELKWHNDKKTSNTSAATKAN